MTYYTDVDEDGRDMVILLDDSGRWVGAYLFTERHPLDVRNPLVDQMAVDLSKCAMENQE